MDDLTREQRHKAMSRIRSKNTAIEVKLRKALWHSGYRYPNGAVLAKRNF